MSKVKEPESKKRTIWDISPLSPPWTTAAVFVLVVFFAMLMKISLSG